MKLIQIKGHALYPRAQFALPEPTPSLPAYHPIDDGARIDDNPAGVIAAAPGRANTLTLPP